MRVCLVELRRTQMAANLVVFCLRPAWRVHVVVPVVSSRVQLAPEITCFSSKLDTSDYAIDQSSIKITTTL